LPIPYFTSSSTLSVPKKNYKYGWGWAIVGGKSTKNRPKKGLIFVTAGAPGRGVLRFFAGAYRRPVHNLPKNAVFSEI